MKARLLKELREEFASKYDLRYDEKNNEWRIYIDWKTSLAYPKTKEACMNELRNMWHMYLEKYIWNHSVGKRINKTSKLMGW